MSGKGGQTIGYHYLFSALFGIGRGPLDELVTIKVADKIAWDGHMCDSSPGIINKPDLFGGEKKEGGIQGIFRMFMGDADQVLPGEITADIASGGGGSFFGGSGGGPYPRGTLPDLKAALGGRSGEFRGRAVLWFDGLMASMNPYIKEWSFRVRRAKKGWDNDNCWYPAKATIFLADGKIHAMNPAHILVETFTNRAWGRGYSFDMLGPTWVYAANTLCAEGLGLCMPWFRRDELGNFIQEVNDHIGAATYLDRETGLIEVKLFRADYNPADLPHFDVNSGLLKISEDDTGSTDVMPDEIIVTGHDPITDLDIEGRSHNIGARQSHLGTATSIQKYRGLPTVELCNRTAARDKIAAGAGLRKFSVTLDRAGFRLHPGAVFKISYAPRNIDNMVLRAMEIDDGNMVNNEITIKCMQDVFSLPLTTWITPVENTYEPPNPDPVAPTDEVLEEATYRDIYLGAAESVRATLAEDTTFIVSLVGRPSVSNIEYDLATRVEGEPSFVGGHISFFTANAILVGGLSATATTLTYDDPEDFLTDDEIIGSALMIDGERLRVDDIDRDTKTMVVARGTVDTWPMVHADGARIWMPDDDVGTDHRTYIPGETVEAKVLTRSGSGTLDPDDAPLLTIDTVGRVFRPYPPADVQVNGVSIYGDPDPATGEPEFTFVERNRITQADVLVGFFEAGMAAEAGTTYIIRIYANETDTVPVREEDPITSGWVYDSAMQAADGVAGVVWAELTSVRDGVESWDPQRFMVVLSLGLRITEDGDIRITEDGSLRALED